VVWDTDWTLVIPGRGTLYLRQKEIGWGEIVGGAGEFAGVTGRFLEIDTLTGFHPGGIMMGRVEFRLEMRRP
jgi:hypothetical protein